MGKIKEKSLIQYLLCYLLILTAGATLWTYVLGGIGFKALIVLLINLLVLLKYKIKIPQSFSMYSIVTLGLFMGLSYYTDGGFLAGNDFNSTLSFVIYTFTAYVIYKIDEENAARIFIRTVYFFAAISIFFFAIQVVLGNGVFPEAIFRSVNYRSEYGFLLYTICKINMRNYGIFYEPGVYQTVLSAALYLLMFNDNLNLSEKTKRKYMIVLSVAVFTTGSTTGYISLAILYVFNVLSGSGSKRMKAGFILLLIVGGIGLDYVANGTDSLIYSIVIRKFLEIGFNRNSGYYRYGTSGGARVYLIDIALQVLGSKPLTGIGSTSYYMNYLNGTAWENGGTGNILCITIAKRGIVFTILAVSYVIHNAYKTKKNLYSFLAYLLVFFNTIFAQSQLVYGVFAFAAFVACRNAARQEIKDTELANTSVNSVRSTQGI